MTRASGIAAAFVVALALAPISAQGQQIFACVNNSSGTIHIVDQNTPCQSNEMLLNWSGGPGGVLAGAGLVCTFETFLTGPGQPLQFSGAGVFFGSGISLGLASPVLQQGIYQIHLSGGRFTLAAPNLFPTISATLNNSSFGLPWLTAPSGLGSPVPQVDIVGGDRLISVGQPNTVLNFIVESVQAAFPLGQGPCSLVITKLQ